MLYFYIVRIVTTVKKQLKCDFITENVLLVDVPAMRNNTFFKTFLEPQWDSNTSPLLPLSQEWPKMAAVFYKLSFGRSTGGQASINWPVKVGFKHSKQTARWLWPHLTLWGMCEGWVRVWTLSGRKVKPSLKHASDLFMLQSAAENNINIIVKGSSFNILMFSC